MINLTQIREAALKANAAVTWGTQEQAQGAALGVLLSLSTVDPLFQAQMLGGVSGPMRPNSDKEPMDPTRYATGRVLHQLGEEANHRSMKQSYERTKPHRDLIKMQRAYTKVLDARECVEGLPPLDDLEGLPGIGVVNTRKLLDLQPAITTAQARQHAHVAALKSLRAGLKALPTETTTQAREYAYKAAEGRLKADCAAKDKKKTKRA